MKYKSILPFFALFSLLFVEINAPLHLYAADSAPLPGIDASSAHTGDEGWNRQEKIEIEENKDLATGTDGATAIQQQTTGGEDLRIGKFTENKTNNWVALLLNQIIALSLGAALTFLGTICSLKMYRIPSILILQTVSLAWSLQAIGFIVAYTVFSKKAVQEFVYDRSKDKDRQLSAIKKMRDNTQKLVDMALAELAVYAALTLGLQSAVVAVIAEKLALMAAEAFEKSSHASMQGLLAAMIAPIPIITANCAIIGACTTGTSGTALHTSIFSLTNALMPIAPPYIQETDDAYIATIQSTSKTIHSSGATLLGTTIPTDASTATGICTVACITVVGCAEFVAFTTWGGAVTTFVPATTAALAGVETLVQARTALATVRKFTLLDCPAALASYYPTPIQPPYMYASCQKQLTPNLINSLFSFLIPPSQAIDAEPIMMGGVGVVLGLASMAAGKLFGMAVTHWMTKAIKLFVHPLTRIIVIQALVLVAIAMEKYMYDIYENLKKRVQDYDDLIKKIKESDGASTTNTGAGDNLTAPGTTNNIPSPGEMQGPKLSPGSNQNAPNTGATTDITTTGVDSNPSASLASQKGLSSNSKLLSGGMDEISPESIEKLSLEELDGKTCLASDPKNPSGNINQGCSCLITKNCMKFEPKGNDESYQMMGSLANDFKTIDKEFSVMTNHFANGRYKDGTKLAAGSNLRSALKRIISLKQQMLDEYNKQRKADPSLPKMDYGPKDPEITDFINGFQQIFDKEGAKDKLNYKISTANSSSELGLMSGQVMKDSAMGNNTSNINSLKWTPPSMVNIKDESSDPSLLDGMEDGEFKMPDDAQGQQQLGDNQTSQGNNKKNLKMKYNSSGIQETSESVFELISRRYMKSVKVN